VAEAVASAVGAERNGERATGPVIGNSADIREEAKPTPAALERWALDVER
jgi:hypothetical protein